MSSGIPRNQSGMIRQEVLNPIVRFSASKREGKLLLKNLRNNLNDLEAAHTMQRLRDQVFSRANIKEKGGKTIGISGPAGNEGATTLSILLGLTLGDLKKNRVMIVDGRLDRKNFVMYSEMFGLLRSHLGVNSGFEFLQCYSTRNQNLSFLTTEEDIGSLDLFADQDISHLLAQLRQGFDYIIFDMPPVLRSSETRILLPQFDFFFLVCSAMKTSVVDVVKSKEIVAEAGCAITGVILNRQRAPFWASVFGREAFF